MKIINAKFYKIVVFPKNYYKLIVMSIIHKFTKHLTKLAFLGALAFGSMAFAEEKDSEREIDEIRVETFVGFHGDMGYQLADGFEMDVVQNENGAIQEITVSDGLFTSELLSGSVIFNENAQFDDIFRAHEFNVVNDGDSHKIFNEYNMFLKTGLEAYVELGVDNLDKDSGVILQAGTGAWMEYHAAGEAGFEGTLVRPEDALYEDWLLSLTLAELLPSRYSQFDNFVDEGGVYLDFHDKTVERKGTAVRFGYKTRGINVGLTTYAGNFQTAIWNESYKLGFELRGSMDNLGLKVPYYYSLNYISKRGDFVQLIGDFSYEDEFWKMKVEFGGGIEWFDLVHTSYIISTVFYMDWNDFDVSLFNSYQDLDMFIQNYSYDSFDNVYDSYGLFRINAERKIKLGKDFMLLPSFGVAVGSFHVGTAFQYDKFLLNVNYDGENKLEMDAVLELVDEPGLSADLISDEMAARYTFFPLSQSVLNSRRLDYYDALRGAVIRGHMGNHRAEVQLDFGHRDIFFSIMAGMYRNDDITHNYGAIAVGHPRSFLIRTAFTEGRDDFYLANVDLLSIDVGVRLGKSFMVIAGAGISDPESSLSLGVEGKF